MEWRAFTITIISYHMEEPMHVGVPRRSSGDPAQVNAELVDLQRGGQTTSNESLGAAVNKRPRTVDFGTPYKRLMSSSGLQSVEVIMMMWMIILCI
ncbi:jg4675 [Pararge aegeria aegeria]|uniref:Jg4675 protein n=1 Tax=Pararge aegeria aegeria TaxID=348720 RepID=A0A8S4R199_9NEOP|nr:jg4675 [Pararge aegeria aegeria]